MTSNTTYIAAMVLGTSLLLAGCSGSAQAPSANSLPTVSNMQRQIELPDDQQGRCQDDGGGDIHVRPCRIKFDADHSGPREVTILHDGDGGNDRGHIIKEMDNCAAGNVATVTRQSNHIYMVAAGTAMGTCTAHFSDNGRHNDDGGPGRGGPGNGNGGDLRIVNAI